MDGQAELVYSIQQAENDKIICKCKCKTVICIAPPTVQLMTDGA